MMAVTGGRGVLPLGKYGLRHETAGASNMQPLHALCTRLQAQSRRSLLWVALGTLLWFARGCEDVSGKLRQRW